MAVLAGVWQYGIGEAEAADCWAAISMLVQSIRVRSDRCIDGGTTRASLGAGGRVKLLREVGRSSNIVRIATDALAFDTLPLVPDSVHYWPT